MTTILIIAAVVAAILLILALLFLALKEGARIIDIFNNPKF
jgi:hypothetical protein